MRLKPKAPTTGYVDGAWWPRSENLAAELPALLAVLAVRLGRIQQVSYNLTTWDTAPRRLDLSDHRVRLGRFRTQHPHTVDVIGANGSRLTLLAILPGTNPTSAHQLLMTAASRGNTDNLDELLAPVGPARTAPATIGAPDDPAVQRWEADGGRA